MLLPARSALERRLLARAKWRIDGLDWFPRPVDVRRVRILHAPWFFRVPGLRRFRGYEIGPLILLAMPLAEASEDLVVHELCHVWQDQHQRAYMWSSYLWQGYRHNEHEVQARAAARLTRPGHNG